MKSGDRRTIIGVMVAIICLLPFGNAGAQTGQQMAEDVWPGIDVLRGMPADEFWDIMGMFAASLGKDCVDCHALAAVDNWDAFAQDTPMLRTTRGMINMVNAINRDNFGGLQYVTCFTCHRGTAIPEIVPELALQYGVPPEKPNAMEFFPSRLAPTADELFDNYFEAIGGTEALSNLTSFVATGTYAGYETGHLDVPLEIYSEPGRSVLVKSGNTQTFDGTEGWITNDNFPIPVLELSGGNLDAARLEALLAYPAMIRGAFDEWKVGITIIDDIDVPVVQGSRDGALPVNFYFADDGLLNRVVYWNQTTMGTVPVQIDLSDYREVSGIRMPFNTLKSWTTGQIETKLTDVRPNAAIPDSRFAR